tara:strand:+ start:112 stop:438 length:327 start_codon:yes stop_codon:yes gene_type:complete
MPDTKIKLNHTDETNKVCPMSGCKANKSIIGKTINVLRANFKYLFKVNLDPKINDKNIIKKGFKNSIGWNLGKIEKSNHLLEPLTSTPKNGTNNKDIKKIIKKTIAIL